MDHALAGTSGTGLETGQRNPGPEPQTKTRPSAPQVGHVHTTLLGIGSV